MTNKANRTAKTGCTWGEQAQWISNVRSGPWPVTMLEEKNGHKTHNTAFGWSNVEIMSRQVSD
jgi:hypothetical protein